MIPTPEQLAAADAIDPAKYEGHAPWPWQRSSNYGQIKSGHTIFSSIHFYAYEQAMRGERIPEEELILDAPLIPVLIHQRDEARRQLATAAAMLGPLSHYLKKEGLNWRPAALCADDCERLGKGAHHADP